MNKSIQPKYHKLQVACSTCGTKYAINSVLTDMKVDVCSSCHPYYTGASVGKSRAGRVDRFNKIASKATTKK